MQKIIRRKWWLVFILVVGFGVVFLGKNNIFLESSCPRLQDLVLYIVASFGGAITLLYAIITKNNSPASIFMSLVVFFLGTIVVSSIGGGYLSGLPQMQAVYCAPTSCEKANLARSLRETGKLDGAADISRACLEDVSGECRKECATELSLALFEKAGRDIDSLPEEWNVDKISGCENIGENLNEAQDFAENYGDETHKSLIGERLQRYNSLCASPPYTLTPTVTPSPSVTPAPTPTPTPSVEVEVLRAQIAGDNVLVDMRVLEGGEYHHDLNKGDFDVKNSEGQNLDFTFEMRDMDDPICMIAVVDNSGSIYPGLKQIWDAIDKLNDLRKPNDQLGLVLFAGRDQVRVESIPSPNPLNPESITGTGDLTALWDGALKGIDVSGECSQESNPYLIVLTDGKDNDSEHLEGDNSDKAIEVSQLGIEAGVDICTVGIESSQSLDADSLRLAAQGCDYYPAEDFDSLATTFQNLFGYVRDFYRITLPIDVIDENNGLVTIVALNFGEVKVDFNE